MVLLCGDDDGLQSIIDIFKEQGLLYNKNHLQIYLFNGNVTDWIICNFESICYFGFVFSSACHDIHGITFDLY